MVILDRLRREAIGREHTKMNKHRSGAAPADRQQAEIFAVCSCCGGEIYLGQLYYEIEKKLVCPECLSEFARGYFLGSQRVAGKWEQMR